MEAPEQLYENDEIARLAELAPRPVSLEQTGLSVTFVGDLLSKHLLLAGVLTPSQLVDRLGLAGPIVEQVLFFLKSEARIETRFKLGADAELRYGLTDRGRKDAQDAAARSGYAGKAPVPLAEYATIVRVQADGVGQVTRPMLREAFRDVVIEDRVLDQLGPALNSGRSIFLYGDAGTGKTYVAQRLARALRGRVLIPHAILVEDTVVQVFDPVLHRTAAFPARAGGLMLEQGHDPRYACCERPVVVSGGELTADMLEVSYDVATRVYSAPLQLKANCGLFLIDDLGRQRIAPAQLFNRWIVPMEEKKDYLSIGAGRHFCVPFRLVLAFSTNFDPLVLADDAFLRRIGYKVELRPITRDQYVRIWRAVCRDRGIEFDRELVEFVIDELHGRRSVPLLPCHPRDLLGMALDQTAYFGTAAIDAETLTRAWDSYFVRIDNRAPGLPGLSDVGEQIWPGSGDRC